MFKYILWVEGISMKDSIKKLIEKASYAGKRVSEKQELLLTDFFLKNSEWISNQEKEAVKVLKVEWMFGKPYVQYTMAHTGDFVYLVSAVHFMELNTQRD